MFFSFGPVFFISVVLISFKHYISGTCQFTSILSQCMKQSLVRQVESESGLSRLQGLHYTNGPSLRGEWGMKFNQHGCPLVGAKVKVSCAHGGWNGMQVTWRSDHRFGVISWQKLTWWIDLEVLVVHAWLNASMVGYCKSGMYIFNLCIPLSSGQGRL